MKILSQFVRALLSAAVGMAVFTGGLSARADEIQGPLARPVKNVPERGQAEVLWGATWYKAVVLEEKDGKFLIKYDGYGDEWNEWVGKDRIRFAGKPLARRQAEVEWRGTWFPAEVLKENDGKFYIKYDGYGEEWNEWVGKDRIRFPGKAPEVVQVEVDWHGTWYPAKILEQKDGKFQIKYDGYGEEWNEWVGKERIRFPGKAAAKAARVEVEWAGTWYPATVLEKKGGKFFIKYDGYGDTFNEWVGPERIRMGKVVK